MKNKNKIIIYTFGLIKIRATNNNIFITLTDSQNVTLIKSSAGLANFSGKKKRTPYVSEMAIKKFLYFYKRKNIKCKILYIHKINVTSYVLSRCIKVLTTLNLQSFRGVITKLNSAHNGMRTKKLKRT